ncbi:hypothetical protein NEMBOFW57_001377 [Staphylotrichum longicolle]|uniref:Secreted protein n=1 Tax=Staphylotrichum longicolle TaxID=669026 RepID=A0AAD4I0S0_9PEZI|nr:hypothetical protein NEMBOFW57_001377 [Staphylotrichum longicolle]
MRFGTPVVTLVLAWSPLTATQASPAAPTQNGALAYPFDLSQVQLTSSRWMDNQNRTIAYLKFIDLNRMLYVFRQTHKLSTQGASKNGGWDAPDFPFRGHFQGHLLSAWAQCWQTTRDPDCKQRAQAFVAELAKCQANNAAAGWSKGYLNGFSENDFTLLEQGNLKSGVPYYVIHKTMAGLLDVWQVFGDNTAKNVLLELGNWVDTRTAKLSTDRMQSLLGTEHGGMVAVLTDMYFQTGDKKWLTVAQRFEHQSVFTPLANNQDQLNGLHANTNIPKWIGAIREFKATGNTRYKSIALNAWNIVVGTRTYAIGSNSQAEHFKAPNAISQFLSSDAGESCNTYNMLKLTRELWTLDPTNVSYFDFYERAVLNQMLGQQDPADHHGHVTYFHSLQPGARRGVGPAWGGGTWSTDYDSFWCCQGTGVETHTKFADSIYFHDASSLYVNLFTPSVLSWAERGLTVTQSTSFPMSGTSTIKLSGNGSSGGNSQNFTVKIRIPAWALGTTVAVNGAVAGSASAGSYASISRAWTAGDTITVNLPMKFRLMPANDNKNLAAVAYGPTVLLSSLKRTSPTALAFSATASGRTVNLQPYYDGQGFNYVTYWSVQGSLPA